VMARRAKQQQDLVHIVVVQQHFGQDLLADVQVVDVGPGVVLACVALAAFYL
jgi:hypothetical protein